MSVCCECCALSGRGLCDELITRPEESYRLWCVVCDLEKQTSRMRRPRPTRELSRQEKKNWEISKTVGYIIKKKNTPNMFRPRWDIVRELNIQQVEVPNVLQI